MLSRVVCPLRRWAALAAPATLAAQRVSGKAGLILGGAVLLAALLNGRTPLSAQTVRGTIIDRTTGKPVADGTLLAVTQQRLSLAQTTTDDSGRFTLVAPGPGTYRLQFQRPGYRLLITPTFELHAGESLDYQLQVTPLPAYALDTAIVEGQVVPKYLAGFYQRRTAGFGAFVTRQEFERWSPRVVTDIIRHKQVFSIDMNANRGQGGDYREFVISGRRNLRYGAHTECPPLLFLDGALMGNTVTVDVDEILAVGTIDAMEFYEGGVQVPTEFAAQGSDCGVITVWSRMQSTDLAEGLHRIDLGAQIGGEVQGGALEYGRLGLQAGVGLIGPVEIYTALNRLVPRWSGPAVPRSGWEVLLSLRARPLAGTSSWYLGGGFAMVSVQDQTGGVLYQPQQDEQRFMLLTGIKLPLPVLRPLVEVQVLGPTHPSRAELHVFTGVTVRVK